ncbi:MAG TPA: XrtA system polysaccharide chain length determinant [Steroidobacteraceae bacterium]|nr:XrtA system polysaccharide chain length determinant [Steroidobacteraceae bacterium]
MAAPPVHAVVQDFLDQLRGAWRFRSSALVVTWCAALLLWVGVFLIPDTYEATARVFVDTRTTLSEATQGLGLGDNVDSQIQRVREALVGAPALEKVAEETNLLVGDFSAESKQAVIDQLQKDIDITGGLSRETPTAAVFTITYKNHSRAKSLQVVDRLVNTFVEGTLGGKRQGSEQAQQFLTAQIADYERRLSAAEQRLADFKRRNAGVMPGEQGDFFTRLQTEQDALEKAKEDLGLAERKRDALARQLRGEDPFLTTGAGASARAGAATDAAAAPGITVATTSDTATQIRVAQARLDELLLRFTDHYPDVIALKQTLKELKAREQAEIAAARRGDPGAAARLGLPANPVYQSVEVAYNQAQVDIATIEQEITDREHNIADLRTRINSAPEVEAEFARLNRDYDVTRGQYKELLERLDRARLGEDAEATGIVKFEVIDPPTAQFQPVEPNRPLLIAGALVLAIAIGLGAGYLLHLLRPVFVSPRQLGAVTGLQVIGSVGMAWLERYRARRRRSSVLYVGWALSLVIVATVVLLLQDHITSIVRELLA